MDAYSKSLRGLVTLALGLLAPLVCAASVAWACADPGYGVPAATSMSVNPTSGLSGSTTKVTGSGFQPGPVEIHWDSPTGTLLASATGPDFSTSVTIPAAPSGGHNIVAFNRTTSGGVGANAQAPFHVDPTPASAAPSHMPMGDTTSPFASAPVSFAPSTPRDTVAPALATAALARQNAIRTVSPAGQVRLFCGSFSETVATGVCAASSVLTTPARASMRGKPKRAATVNLGPKPFHAAPGRPVWLSFQLTKSSLRTLTAAKQIRMRGSIDARDASGNLTHTSFTFTLKAPKPHRR